MTTAWPILLGVSHHSGSSMFLLADTCSIVDRSVLSLPKLTISDFPSIQE